MDINPNFTLKPISQLNHYCFVVEDYQRGYKWNIQQVLDLLNDISGFDKSKQGFYCLQPVVVKKLDKELGKKHFELIDGQQRITTIFILLTFLKKKCSKEEYNLPILTNFGYSIKYGTRSESADFLEQISSIKIELFEQPISQKQLNAYWESYIEQHPLYDNVDNYHFFMAYQIIGDWFREADERSIESFSGKLLNHTEVIWYKISNDEAINQTAEQVFINFNQGKISLAQAELIKALFVLQLQKEANKELRAFKINQFAQEWNTIESQLQQNDFWYFISNDTSDRRKANRIDFLFDIIQGKGAKEKDKLFAYRKYLEVFNKNKDNRNTGDILKWSTVKLHFDIFLEWYNERTIYHLIGFLVSVQLKNFTISKILEEYKKATTKQDFKQTLLDGIKSEFLDKEAYALDNLGYDNNNNIKQNTFKILLLFNVITYENSDMSYRFPFNASKENQWSLEHIHAQNPKDFETIEEVKEWVKDLERLSANYQKTDEFKKLQLDVSPVKNQLSKTTIDGPLKDAIDKLMEDANRIFNKDSLDNLCLLDKVTNSIFNNDNFIQKRKKLIEIDKKGFVMQKTKRKKPFIPLTTKQVFLKYYTEGKDIQMTYWGIEDRKAYHTAIKTTLANYLNPKNG